MIEIRGLCKTFNPGTVNENIVFHNLNLTLNEGDFITVIGGNGAGKSTLLNIISGSIEADSGMILLNDVDVSSLREYQRAPYFGHVFQDPMKGTAPDMTVLENLALAYGRGRSRSLFRWSIRVKDRQYYVDQLKSLGLGLEDKIHQKVGLLSGGQRQALTLLMATMGQKPSHRKIVRDYTRFYPADPQEVTLLALKKQLKSKYKADKNAITKKDDCSSKEKRKLLKQLKKQFIQDYYSKDIEYKNSVKEVKKNKSLSSSEKKIKLQNLKENYLIELHGSKMKAKIEVTKVYRNGKKECHNEVVKILKEKIPGSEKKQKIKEAFERFDAKMRVYDLTKPVLLLDEHTAALDPATAKKVLEITDKIVSENNLTTIMITHNMKDAITHGNRLIMMSKGKIVVDVSGEEKKKLTIEDLLEKFTVASNDSLSDSTILGD